MTDKEAMKLALDALTYKKWFLLGMGEPNDPRLETAITSLNEKLAQPEQEPVAWPCLIDSADFSKGTITVVMQCADYKVSAGMHWLSTQPPQRTEQEPDDIASIIACRNMLDAQPVPPKENT